MSTNPLSGKALAAGTSAEPSDPTTLFITWTTYGTWLPGDSRGWQKFKSGEQQPLLEDWCGDQMKDQPLYLNETQRAEVESVIRKHAGIRGWKLHAVSVRSNHVHVAVTVVPKMSGKTLVAGTSVIKRVRDQFKADGTTTLRRMENPVAYEKVWKKGGDIQIIETDDDLE